MLNSARFSADGPQRRLRRITCFAIDLLKTCVARLRKHVTSVCRTTVCAVLVTPSYKACHGQSLPICNMSNNAKHQADTGELRHAKRRGRPGVCNEHLAIGGVLPGWASASSAAHYGPSDVAFKGLAAAADESPTRRLPQPARDKRVARRQIEGFIRHARRTSRREN